MHDGMYGQRRRKRAAECHVGAVEELIPSRNTLDPSTLEDPNYGSDTDLHLASYFLD